MEETFGLITYAAGNVTFDNTGRSLSDARQAAAHKLADPTVTLVFIRSDQTGIIRERLEGKSFTPTADTSAVDALNAVHYRHPNDAHEEAERRLGGTATGAPPTAAQKFSNQIVTAAFIDLMAAVLELTPAGPNQKLALIHIEDAKMRAVNAIFQDGDQS